MDIGLWDVLGPSNTRTVHTSHMFFFFRTTGARTFFFALSNFRFFLTEIIDLLERVLLRVTIIGPISVSNGGSQITSRVLFSFSTLEHGGFWPQSQTVQRSRGVENYHSVKVNEPIGELQVKSGSSGYPCNYYSTPLGCIVVASSTLKFGGDSVSHRTRMKLLLLKQLWIWLLKANAPEPYKYTRQKEIPIGS